MDYSWHIVKRLLGEIEEEIGMEVSNANFSQVKAALSRKYEERRKNPFPINNPEYVYRSLTLQLKKKAKRKSDVPLNAVNVEALVHALGYKGYHDFRDAQHPSVSSDLKGCEGFWYSYVRCNSGQPYVLRAPVHISVKFRDVLMLLKGKQRIFEGKMKLQGDCIYCLLESGDTKNLHFVLKTGLASRPDVLQGVFSGLSSGNDPIAGREVLVRQPAASQFGELTPERMAIDSMLKSKTEEQKIVAHYFSSKADNILKAGRSSAFDITDLMK